MDVRGSARRRFHGGCHPMKLPIPERSHCRNRGLLSQEKCRPIPSEIAPERPTSPPCVTVRYISAMTSGSSQQAPDRNLAMELVRVTEAAALAAARSVGRGAQGG